MKRFKNIIFIGINGNFKIRFLIVLSVFAFQVKAQRKADSLITLANSSKNDSLKVKLLNDAVWELMFTEKQRAGEIAEQAIKIAEKTKNPYSLSDCYNTTGVYYYVTSDFQTSLKYHQGACEIRKKLRDTLGLMKTYNNLASVLKELGDYKTEVEYYFKALKISETKKDSFSQSAILSNIADAFRIQEQYAKSEEYHLLSLKLREKLGDANGVTACYVNLGGLNHDWKHYNESEAYFKKAEGLLKPSQNNYLLAKYYSNYGSLLMDMKRFEEAGKLIEKAIECNNKIGNENSNLINYINVANIYHHLKFNDRSNEAYAKAYELAVNLGNKLRQKECLLGLSNTFAKKNDYENAFDCRLKYETLNDTLRSKEMNELFAETETKYQVEKKDVEIKLLGQKNENTELKLKQRTLLTFGISLLFLLMIVLGYFIWSRNKIKQRLVTTQKIKEAEEAERLRIAKDIHDELGSGLTKIRFMSEVLATNNKDNNSIKTISDTAKSLVDNMRDLIWAMNPENTKLDNLVARIREYSNDYLEEFPLELKIDFPDEIQSLTVTKDAHRNIFMVVKECLQNIVKHAEATEVVLQISIDDAFQLNIKDNGKGFDSELKTEGNGLKNIRNRIKNINGKVIISSDKNFGTQIKIAIEMKNILKS